MLESYFESTTRVRQLRRGPLAEHIGGLAGALRVAGYSRSSGRTLLSLAGKFSQFARLSGVERAEDINETLAEQFVHEELAGEGVYGDGPNAMRHVLEHLRRAGVIPRPGTPPADEDEALLDRYRAHLRDVRGLAPDTCEQYRCGARRLLSWFRERHGDRPLGRLSGPDVLDFVTEMVELHSGGKWRQHLCSRTRIFLRYLRWEEILETDLDRVVPKVPRWRLDSLPRHLPWEQVRALIDGVDTTSPEGMRDKAILLLLAALGLRGGEVCTLEVGFIAWRAGELHLPKTKNRKERVMPLPQEVGAAVADYLLHGRPAVEVPQVFLRHRAPVGPFETTGGIGAIIDKHLRRSGIAAPSRGSHLLRHSLATRMVNVGVPIKTIADVLGHASIDTTAIYTKVDLTTLASVALPFPSGGAR
jgi:site-specific recombinase XerD